MDILSYIGELLPSTVVTIQLTLMAAGFATILSLVAGLARLSPWRLVRSISAVYVEVFRGTSALVQLFWAYFALPIFGVNLSPIAAATLVLSLNVGAYGSEVVRGAVLAVPVGQYEAAIALNLSSWQRFRRVTLPLAGLAMIPPAGNLVIELLKGTALVSLISVADVTYAARELQSATGETTLVFTALLLVYFMLSLLITAFFRTLEHRLSKHRRPVMTRQDPLVAR